MEIGIPEMYLIIIVTIILMIVLRINVGKLADTRNITRIDVGEDGNRREFIASGMTDPRHHGSKILVVLYSLFCRNCDSTDIFAEISDDKEHIELVCRKCGYITLIPLKKMIIHEYIDEGILDDDEEKAVREYIRALHAKHTVDIIDPDEHKPNKKSEED